MLHFLHPLIILKENKKVVNQLYLNRNFLRMIRSCHNLSNPPHEETVSQIQNIFNDKVFGEHPNGIIALVSYAYGH